MAVSTKIQLYVITTNPDDNLRKDEEQQKDQFLAIGERHREGGLKEASIGADCSCFRRQVQCVGDAIQEIDDQSDGKRQSPL